ncbi:MAG: hypothetical protein Ct9H300mP1_11570 [Planctomycetaceae bacterium]|nr:MAG: hypothetical protein Ct9H300mP1_11570 [Planctomycetaceae bacterium]
MKTGQPDASYDQRLQVAQCLANQLQRPYQRSVLRQRMDSHLQHIWYQEVLVEGLAGVGILQNKQAQPFVETGWPGCWLIRTAISWPAPLRPRRSDGRR